GRPHADPLPCLEHHASTERTRAVGASGLDDQEHEHGRELRVGRPGPVTHPAARLDGELACGCLARERRTYDERHRTRAKGRVLGRGMLQARREPMLGSPVWAVGRVTEEKGVTEPLLYVAEAEVMTSARIMAGDERARDSGATRHVAPRLTAAAVVTVQGRLVSTRDLRRDRRAHGLMTPGASSPARYEHRRDRCAMRGACA